MSNKKKKNLGISGRRKEFSLEESSFYESANRSASDEGTGGAKGKEGRNDRITLWHLLSRKFSVDISGQ